MPQKYIALHGYHMHYPLSHTLRERQTMVYRPSEYREVPPVDLLSWIFEDNGVDPDEDVCCHLIRFKKHQAYFVQILIDAANPRNRFNSRQAVSLIRRLIAGLRAAGLVPGDTVCVHAFNSVSLSKGNLGIPLSCC